MIRIGGASKSLTMVAFVLALAGAGCAKKDGTAGAGAARSSKPVDGGTLVWGRGFSIRM